MDEVWITVEEAAALGGYHPQHVRELARAGRIHAKRFGRLAWQIERASLLAYMTEMQERGRKRGPRPDSPTDTPSSG
jgi:excisionase family DNA binding protein